MAKAAQTENGARTGPVSLGRMPYSEVTPGEVRERLSNGEDVFLLDVREPDEVAEWAYPIGVNIPLGQLGARVDELPRDRTIVVACHVGGRSAQAATALSDAGYTAENLAGGAVAWVASDPEPESDPG
jgi:rhodanese-related sulfurtransferase